MESVRASLENEPRLSKLLARNISSIFWFLFHFLIIHNEYVDKSAINWRLAAWVRLLANFCHFVLKIS